MHRSEIGECNPHLDVKSGQTKTCGKSSIEVVKDESGNTIYKLFFVEFDEQGRLYNDKQLNDLVTYFSKKIEKYSEEDKHLPTKILPWKSPEPDVSIVTFVHGWRHSAYFNDSNVNLARGILKFTYDGEQRPPQATPTRNPREVVGIYVGWRGKSLSFTPHSNSDVDVAELTTVWDRKNTAQNVAIGSVRELFSYLRSFKQRANELRSCDGNSDLFKCQSVRHLIVGHSFGGLIAYNSQAESLIDSVTKGALGYGQECNEKSQFPNVSASSQLVKQDADLTIVINPAVEGVRYEPLFQAIERRRNPPEKSLIRTFCPNQRPVFIGFSATSDTPNAKVFPWSRSVSTLLENTTPEQPNIADLEKYTKTSEEEREAALHTLGQISRYKTHDLKMAQEPLPYNSQNMDDADKLVNLCHSRKWMTNPEATKKVQACMAHVEELNISRFKFNSLSGAVFCGGVTFNTKENKNPNESLPTWIAMSNSDEIIKDHGEINKFPFLTMVQQLYHALTLSEFTQKGFLQLGERILSIDNDGIEVGSGIGIKKPLRQVINDHCAVLTDFLQDKN